MRAKNHWKPWTPAEEQRLVELAEQDVSSQTIAIDLDRSVDAIRNKARCLGIVLPLYNHRKRTGPAVPSGQRARTASARPTGSVAPDAHASTYSSR
jgi:hypothetical protein